MRRLVYALTVFTCGTVPLALTSVADAKAMSVTVTPDSNLVSGQSVSVQGSSSGASSVLLIECSSNAVSTIGSPYNSSWCDNSNTVTTPVDSAGTFSATFTFNDPLSTGNGPVDCSVSGACVLVTDNPTPGDVMADNPVSGNSCNGVFSGSDSGRSFKSTDAGPGGSTVVPGQKITVTLTWTPSDYPTHTLDKTDDCVKIGGTISTTLSQEHKPQKNTGTDTFSYVVPVGTIPGTQVCDRGAVHGPGSYGTEKTNAICYTVGPGTATPEFSRIIVLPAVGGGVIFVGVLVGTRRRKGRVEAR
jgi:hypothetical protein